MKKLVTSNGSTARRIAYTLFGVLVVMVSPLSRVNAADQKTDSGIELRVSPDRCVALTQGQICYQTIIFTWEATEENEYCLFQKSKRLPLVCWEKASAGKVTIEFESPETLHFELKLGQEGKIVGESEIMVTWVYGKQKKRRTSWRLF